MQTETIEYKDGGQLLIGKLFWQQQAQNLPVIIVFPAFEGRSEFALNYARRLAEQGFAAFAADIYGDAKTASTIEGCFELITPFLHDRSLVRRRAGLAYETVAKHSLINSGQIGAIGFCFGGMCMLELARSGANLRAGVSAHGVLAKSDLETSRITSKLLILHGYRDPQVPPEQLASFAAEMDAAGVIDWTVAFFGHAKHSFTDPLTGTFNPEKEQAMGREYNPAAAERTFRYAVDFFQEHLI